MLVKIADAVVELIENELKEGLITADNGTVVIIPKLDHGFCVKVLEYAGKERSKGYGQHRVELECNRVAKSLENDSRFFKYIHCTGIRAFEYNKCKIYKEG